MSDYFDSSINRISDGTKSSEDDVNNLRDEVGTAFDMLPSPTKVGNGSVTYAADSGSANTYAIALPVTATAYAVGMTVTFIPGNANTGASTLNVDSLGTKSIKRPDGTDVQAGDITTSAPYTMVYDGTNFVIQYVGTDSLPNTSGNEDLPLFVNAAGTAFEALAVASARTKLGLAIGSDVQAYSSVLDTYAGIDPAANIQSLLGAADYAAIRALLDLEAGTDFYSATTLDARIATTTTAGFVEEATDAEVKSGEDGKFVDAAGLHAAVGGLSQTLQDMSASRSSGVTYTNNTGKIIWVIIQSVGSTGAIDWVINIDGDNVLTPRKGTSTGTNDLYVIFPVMPGKEYTVTISSTAFDTWYELR